MIFENMKKMKYMKRLLLTLLLPVFTLASSFVHAQDYEVTCEKTTEQESYPVPLLIPADGDAGLIIDSFEDISSPSGIPNVQSLTLTASSTDSLYQGTDFDSFYEHTVFIGDSLTVGFQGFCCGFADSIASESTYFLARESCSAQAAISDKALTAFSNIMPKYQDKVQLIEDSVAQMPDVEKVFICFGMNDLVSATPEKFVQNLDTLISRILVKSPNVSVYILSIPCITEGVQTGSLSNTSIQNANMLLNAICIEKQWGFINTTEYLMSETHSIQSKYSSDGYVHENAAAYRIWTKVLRNYVFEAMH